MNQRPPAADTTGDDPRTVRRRRRRATWLWVVGVLALIVFLGIRECRMLDYTRHDLYMSDLPRSFEGLKVVQLTDVHVGLVVRPDAVKAMVRRVNAMNPDVVLLTGDYVNRVALNIEPMGESLRGLHARYGVYAILGNHDYWTGAGRVRRALLDDGFDLITNEQRRISIGKESIRLVGFDDIWAGEPDYVTPMKGIRKEDLCIAIAHNPDAVFSLRGKPVDLLLAGHTHGGQIVLPFYGPIYSPTRLLDRRHASGMFTVGGIRTYVSRGIGQITPIRFRCTPEVPVFILHHDPMRNAEPSECGMRSAEWKSTSAMGWFLHSGECEGPCPRVPAGA